MTCVDNNAFAENLKYWGKVLPGKHLVREQCCRGNDLFGKSPFCATSFGETTCRENVRLAIKPSRMVPHKESKKRLPIEINRAIYTNTHPYCLTSLVHYSAFFRAFWVCIDMHSNYFDFANKNFKKLNYFRKIMGMESGEMALPHTF